MESTPPPFKRKGIIQLSWPLLCVTVFTLLGTLGNTVIFSMHSPGLNAAVATANQLLGIFYDITVIFSLGGLVVITQNLGAGESQGAQRASVTVLRSSTLLGVGLALVIFFGAPIALSVLNTPEELSADARTYLWIVAFGLTFNAYITAAVSVLRGYGHTLQLLVMGVIINILDVGLLALLILFLDWGVVGAALPTLLVRGIGVGILWMMVKDKTGVTLFTRFPSVRPRNWTGPATMARKSVPSVVENLVYNLAILYMVMFINQMGTEAINARSYTLTLTALITGILLALSQGSETIVGWDVGEGAYAHASRQAAKTAGFAAGMSALLAFILWFFADAALGIFGVSDEVAALAKPVLLISVLLLPLSGITAVYYGALRSAGDVVFPMVYSLGSSIGVILPLSWILMRVFHWGLPGAFWALAAGEAVKAGLLMYRWKSKAWTRYHHLVESDKTRPSIASQS
ncbi:MATE family efflux transporter [Kiritimatiellaeota bacterium B1221]|nr:MATE family efflux transporter [Kiritimatiellaeota bacterium B1221]